ncbi:hypothetical protein CsSME_00002217 [Camellia sinensis var. sinensis]
MKHGRSENIVILVPDTYLAWRSVLISLIVTKLLPFTVCDDRLIRAVCEEPALRSPIRLVLVWSSLSRELSR